MNFLPVPIFFDYSFMLINQTYIKLFLNLSHSYNGYKNIHYPITFSSRAHFCNSFKKRRFLFSYLRTWHLSSVSCECFFPGVVVVSDPTQENTEIPLPLLSHTILVSLVFFSIPFDVLSVLRRFSLYLSLSLRPARVTVKVTNCADVLLLLSTYQVFGREIAMQIRTNSTYLAFLMFGLFARPRTIAHSTTQEGTGK